MSKEFTDDCDISCHLQVLGMGTLLCRAARQTGTNTTNEVKPINCYECDAGKIYREIGCDAVSPKISISPQFGGNFVEIEALFCNIRRRDTSFEYCRTCGLAVAETTKQIVGTARGLFIDNNFYSAYKDFEKAREAIRDGNFENAVTRSIACVESVMRICHEKLEQPLPDKKQVTDLWKSVRVLLRFEEIDSSGSTQNVVNSLSGVVTNIASLRNALSDAHGKGMTPVEVPENIAELSINCAATIGTFVIRRFIQIRGDRSE